MPWQKMRFRGDAVFVHVDDGQQIVLDSDGRAEMKYREADAKSYRPGPANLTPLSDSESAAASASASASASGGPAATKAEGKPPAARKTATRSGVKAGAATKLDPTERSSTASADPAGIFHVWTDGACSGNPGPMGIGVVVLVGEQRQEIGEYLGIGTNNIAELVAIERGLEAVAERLRAGGGPAAPPSTARVRVYSDSSYAIGLLDKGWKAKANQDLVARIRAGLAAFAGRVEFVKVPGHAGVPENERCDQLGRDAINGARRHQANAR